MSISTIGKRIRFFREEKKWSQEVFAEKLGLSLTYIGMIERGEKIPKLETFINTANTLMESDRINVAYIMNLIRNINFESKQTRDRDIEHIKDELDRSDNMRLHKKIDILRAFLDLVVSGFDGTEDIDAEYNDFENKQKSAEIEAFAEKEGIDSAMLNAEIAEYEFTGVLNPGQIRDKITTPMPLLKKKSLVSRIADFIRSHVDKFSN